MLPGSVATEALSVRCLCVLPVFVLPGHSDFLHPVQTHPTELDLVTLLAFCRRECDCVYAPLCALCLNIINFQVVQDVTPTSALQMLRRAPLRS